jgi:hypothetical protein
VVDKKRIIRKQWRTEEEERHKGSLVGFLRKKAFLDSPKSKLAGTKSNAMEL